MKRTMLLMALSMMACQPSDEGMRDASSAGEELEHLDMSAPATSRDAGSIGAGLDAGHLNPTRPDLGASDPTRPDPDAPLPQLDCAPTPAGFGGVFTDSDGTAARIDDSITFEQPGGSSYSRDDLRAMLSAPIPMGGNLHTFAFEHIMPAHQTHGWPEAAHLLLRYIQANARVGGLTGSDGVTGEGMNYHFLWLAGLLRLARELDGYTDPAGWSPPPGVQRIDQPLTHETIMPPSKRWSSFVTNAVKLTLPDGTDSGSHDTGVEHHDGSKPDQTSSWGAGGRHYGFSIAETARSYILPAYGQAGLGEGRLGEPKHQVQSLLHFSPKVPSNGHAHNDTLMLGFFANGRNLLSFPAHQDQTHGPENKNMVMIDGTWQNKYVSDIGGRLEMYHDLPGIKVLRVDASHIIHGGNPNGTGSTSIDRYRRTLIQNTIDIEKPYLLDVFEVSGGGSHDYLLRGSEVLEQRYPTTNLPLRDGAMPIANTQKVKFSGTKVASFDQRDSFWVDLVFQDSPETGTRTHFPAGLDGELYINKMDERWTADHIPFVPQFTIHREAATDGAGLDTTFIAVHEALDGSGESFIRSVSRSALGDDASAVTIILEDGRRDVYLISHDGVREMSSDGVQATAKIAAASGLQGRSDLWLFGGTHATDGARVLEAARGEQLGDLVQVNRREHGASSDSLDTTLELPEGYNLSGQAIILEGYDGDELVFSRGYEIERVERVCDGRTRVHIHDDPGVNLDAGRVSEMHHPWRSAARARLRFVTGVSTVPYIARALPGHVRSARLDAQVARALPEDGAVRIVRVPDDAHVEITLDDPTAGEQTRDGLRLSRDARVVYSAINQGGFVQAPEEEERYYMPLAALTGPPGEPGLLAKRWSGYTYNFDLDDPVNSYDFGRFGSEVVHGLSFSDVPYDQVGAGSGVLITGSIDVPRTGLYRFYTRMDRAVQLSIDGRVLIDERGMRYAPQWVGEIYLERGLHELQVFHYSQVNAHFAVAWSGPGFEYGDIPGELLYHTPKE